jgi:hypothetical protein
MLDTTTTAATLPVVPTPRCPSSVRVATMTDLPFIDRLQKMHREMVGWMPAQQLEGKIGMGQVIIAESAGVAVGYCIGQDQYFKRDDVGIIYQMNVVPASQRGLIGATLVKAMFDRAAYGCRLFCCWCAQDIAANRFWESLGFIPLAFRAGSRQKGRVHIFWQRRIRAGDRATPYWFPSQTTSGSIRENRLVLPIPPGTHWSEAKPIILPGEELAAGSRRLAGKRKKKPAEKRNRVRRNGLWYDIPAQPTALALAEPGREKNDPKLIAAARELRDRWLERVNADPSALDSGGKYDVTREFERAASLMASATPLLEAA